MLDLQKTAVSMRDLQGEEILVSTCLVVCGCFKLGAGRTTGGRWAVVGCGWRRGAQVVVPSLVKQVIWCQVCPLILIYYYK